MSTSKIQSLLKIPMTLQISLAAETQLANRLDLETVINQKYTVVSNCPTGIHWQNQYRKTTKFVF
jgi:hypothetical protein